MRLPLRSPPRSPRPLVPLAAALLAGLLAGLLGACQELGPERASATVRFREVAPLDRERFVVTLTDGERQFYLEGVDLTAGADGWLTSRLLRVASTGRLVVRVALRGDGAAPAASGDAAIPLSPQANWRLDVFPSALSPAEVCGGCAGLRRILIAPSARPSAQDWLYLTWTADPALDPT